MTPPTNENDTTERLLAIADALGGLDGLPPDTLDADDDLWVDLARTMLNHGDAR